MSNYQLFFKMEFRMMKKLTVSTLVQIFLLLVFSVSSDAQVVEKMGSDSVDQIHFSVINGTAITFDWVGTADHIYIGTDPDNLENVVSAIHPPFLPVESPWVSDPGPYWEAKLVGLKQNTVYFYKIGSNGHINKFKTPPQAGTAGFRVCAMSDMHESSKESVAMFNQVADLKPDLVITPGDLTGAGPDGQQEVGARFHEAMIWAQSAAWMPAWGNHDWGYPDVDDLRTYKARFDIPNPGTISSSPSISCCGEDWGWFDYGNTRFISLPEPWDSSTRAEWSDQVRNVFSSAQDDPNIKFIVTYGHRSSYTSTFRRSPGEESLRKILDGFHASYSKYRLDLSGHNHQYERYLLSSGMTYIIASSAGSYYHEGWDSPDKPSECAYRAIHYGILVLDFSDNTIRGQFICSVNATNSHFDYKPLEEAVCSEIGEVIDAFTITSP
jgi:hypothetical protein